MSRAKKLVAIIATISLAVRGGYLYWQQDQPRRNAAQAVSRLASALMNPNSAELLDPVPVPAVIQGHTSVERPAFLTKALRDEISAPSHLSATIQSLAATNGARDARARRGAAFTPIQGRSPNSDRSAERVRTLKRRQRRAPENAPLATALNGYGLWTSADVSTRANSSSLI